jgi:hypothetical protein
MASSYRSYTSEGLIVVKLSPGRYRDGLDVRQKGTPLMQSRNRFLNGYENYRIINNLLELNSPAPRADTRG